MDRRTRQAPFFQLLRELHLDLAGTEGLEAAFQRILAAALACGGADCGAVYHREADGAMSRMSIESLDEAFTGFPERYAADSQEARWMLAGEPLCWDIHSLAQRTLPGIEPGPLRAMALWPILREGLTIGSFVLGSRNDAAITDEAMGRFEVLAALASNVTQRRQAQQALARREALFSNLYRRMPMAYHSLDSHACILEVNDAWEQLFECPREQAIGRCITDFLEETSLPAFGRGFASFLEHGQIRGFEMLIHTPRKGTRQVQVNSQASLDEEGRFLHSHSLVSDITEQRRVDAETRARLTEQQLILDHAMVGIALFHNRVLIDCNPRLETLFGYAPGELIGQSAEIIHRDHAHFVEQGEQYFATLAKGDNYSGQDQFRRKDGQLIWLHVSGRATDPENLEQSPIVWIFIDISQQMQAEAAIRQINVTLEAHVAQRTAELQQLNRDLESFSYSVSHDLRAPLRAINGYAQIVLENEQARLSADGGEMLGRIVHNSNRMGQLIDDILEYSRTGRAALSTRTVDLDALVRALCHELAEAHPGARIDVEPLPSVEGDPTMLRQVFENLIRNALKYTGRTAAPRIEIGCRMTADRCTIFVRDNGAGFDMKYAGKLFGMFQRMHNEREFSGTGVGLAICKRIVERHGGEIRAEARPGAGATFFVTLPRQQPDAGSQPAA